MAPVPADLTIVVAPREKYSLATRTFTALVDAEGPPFHLVWVDEARAPRAHRRWVVDHANRPEVTHVALPHRAGANECRMRGFEASSSPYVLFIDNDAFLAPGALEALTDCMRTTGASFVTPFILDVKGRSHHAGGDTAIVQRADGRSFVEDLPFQGPPAAAVRPLLDRSRTTALEMHAVLVRADSLRAAGGFDTGLQSSLDCADLSLRLKGWHESGWLEPGAIATYDSAAPHASDLPLFLGRWSRATVEHDIARFAASWGIDLHDPRLEHHRHQLRMRRMRVVRYLRGGARRAFGTAAAERVEDAVEPLLDTLAKVRVPG
jgi:hypothetical protein